MHELIHIVHSRLSVVRKVGGKPTSTFRRISKPKKKKLAKEVSDGNGVNTNNVCHSCNVRFVSVQALQEHKKLVALTDENYPVPCPYCKEPYSSHDVHSECDFLQHKKIFKFSCQLCSCHFENESLLRKHLNKMHDHEDKKQCPGCSRWFGAQLLQQHMEYIRKAVDKLECKCLACGMVFDSVEKLDEHGAVRKAKCSICSQHFNNTQGLINHAEYHHNLRNMKSDESDYKCKHCDHLFERMSQLSAHVKKVILETEPTGSLLCSWEGKFKTCFTCGMAFQKQSDFNIHKSIWSFTCFNCKHHFPRVCAQLLLKDHAHQQESGLENCLSCKYCEQKFPTVMAKRSHERKSSWLQQNYRLGDGYPCLYCEEVMPTGCQLHLHRQAHTFKESKSIDKTCIVRRAKLTSSDKKSIHMKECEAKRELRCDFCKKQFDSTVDFHEHETPRREKYMCTVCNTNIVASCQTETHKRSCIEGKTCAYCLKKIKGSSEHSKYQRVSWQCTSCGIKAHSKCHKQTHAATYKLVCPKCNRHFQTVAELLDHFMTSRRMWNTCGKDGQIVCSYCGEEVENDEQRREHESMFWFKCWICKKHFSSALEMIHHFLWTNHGNDIKKADPSMSITFDNILQTFLQKAECPTVKYAKSTGRSKGVQYQLGSLVYSLLPSRTNTKSTRSPQDVCEGKLKLNDSTKGLLYICTKCNLSFDKLSEVEKHRCSVCCYCTKRFYGSNVRVKKKRHEKACSKDYPGGLGKEGTSTVREVASLDASEEGSKLQGTQEEEDDATLATDSNEKQDDTEVETISVRRDGDDASMAMNVSDKQQEARDRALCTREVIKLEGGLEVMCEQVMEGNTGLGHAMREDDTDMKSDDEIARELDSRPQCLDEENEKEKPGYWEHGDVVGKRKQKKVQRLVAGGGPEFKRRKSIRATGKFSCPNCRNVFTTRLYYRTHMKENSFEGICCICVHCNVELKSKCHVRFHHEQYPHTCSKCKQHFDKLDKLKSHKSTCKNLRRCGSCNQSHFRLKSLDHQHRTWHTPGWKKISLDDDETDVGDEGLEASNESLECHVRDPKEVLDHARSKHVGKDTTTSACVCSRCKRHFSNANSLKRHMMGHEADEALQTKSGLYICSTCMKRYDSLSQFDTHRKTYCSNLRSGDTVHVGKDTTKDASACVCNACKRCFSSAGFLLKHLMGHVADEACQTQSGLYICSTCMNRYDYLDSI